MLALVKNTVIQNYILAIIFYAMERERKRETKNVTLVMDVNVLVIVVLNAKSWIGNHITNCNVWENIYHH